MMRNHEKILNRWARRLEKLIRQNRTPEADEAWHKGFRIADEIRRREKTPSPAD